MSPHSNKNTLLFDFDGVMVDSFNICYSSMKEVTTNFPDKEVYRSWYESNIYDANDISNGKVDENNPFFKVYIPLLMELKPIRGISEAINALGEKYRMVVVSSTVNSPIKKYLDNYNLSAFFDKIYGGDVLKSKTAKINMVFTDFNVKPENCFFITDTAGDIKEATKSGVE